MINYLGFDYTPPLKKYINLLASGDRNDRTFLTRLDPNTTGYFGGSLEMVSNLLPDADQTKAYITISLLTRILWSLVPRELVTSPLPDFKQLAKKSLSKFNISNDVDFDNLISDLAKIFKRIRRVYLEGRLNAKSLNLDNKLHLDLFKYQHKRCAICSYEFDLDQYRFSIEDDGIEAFPYFKQDNELCLSQTFRQPELDHIIPYVLGGDMPDNWQILCKSCNLGKSDYINYMSVFANQSSNRLSDLESLTYGKRYAVIASNGLFGDAISDHIFPGDGKFFRIFKKSEEGFLTSMNLDSKYC